MRYNGDAIDQITTGIDVDNIFNGITVIIAIWITISTLILFLDTLAIIFDVIDSDIHILNKYKYRYDKNNDTTIIINTWCKIGGATFTVALFVTIVFFNMQVLDIHY